LKVLIIQPWIRLGGAETVSVNLAYELQRLGHQVAIVCTYFDGAGMPEKACQIDYRLPPAWISRLIRMRRALFLLLSPWVLLCLAWRYSSGADVLNPHEFPSSWIAVLVSAIRGIPVVWSSYGPPPRLHIREARRVGLGDWLGWRIASSWLDRLMVKQIAAIHVPSKRSRDQVWERYQRVAAVIPLGVDAAFYGGGTGSHTLLRHGANGRPVLLSVGKLHPQENHAVCLRVLKRILPIYPEACLVIAGDGPLLQYYQDLAEELGIADRVRFLGHLPCWEVRELYQCCHVHLYPPKNESWGLAPFEALCAGRVSIVSRESGAAEVIGGRGIGVVSEPTAEAFARHLQEVLDDPKGHLRMALEGRDYVAGHLTWRQHATSFLDVVRDACRE
jgi:glycosyltransferase involved in cell wall biosynthesis